MLRVLVCFLMFLIASHGFAHEESGKKPVPDETSRNAAKAVVVDVYQDEHQKAKSRHQKIELAKTFLMEADATTDEYLSARYVLYEIGRDMAAQQGDLTTAMNAIHKMDGKFLVDRLQMQVEAAKISSAKRLGAPQVCGPLLVPLIDEAVSEDRYDLAKNIAEICIGYAREARDGKKSKALSEIEADIELMAAKFTADRISMDMLEQLPADPEANLAVGKFLCFTRAIGTEGSVCWPLEQTKS